MTAPVVIVGAGQAGVETAVALRSKGFDDPIVILGDERCAPYQRPPLSKEFLKAPTDSDDIALRPAAYFDRNNIDLRCGRNVTGIDRDAGSVRLADGTAQTYQHLVLATGTRNRRLNVPGADLGGLHYLRTLDEAHALTARLKSCASVVVIGAGFIGLEVAAAARAHGADVTVVEAAERPMGRAVSRQMSDYYADLHRSNGVRLLMNTGVGEIAEKDGRAATVITTAGERIDADVIVVGIGVIPNTELAAAAGLAVDNGVVVDSMLSTEDANISAVGDCAAYPLPSRPGLVRLESVQNAVDHARCVAARLTGQASDYDRVAWFWTEQFDSKLQMAGLVTGYDRAILRGDPGRGSFSVFCFGGDVLLGVESVNAARDHMAARKLLAGRCAITPEQAADVGVDLKSLVTT
ncbi:NAD(P)/FAD-dependent oxidoreductase [Mycolicibacterium austroafricanum]|uniref:NAD(P)/FAD-dependent oxidoreductase n=1 Tax=Mycolicibacterium austroafricanum TaxID=39687 RepID=UPI0005628618|nr:FAD-dependent oxidoreductase [Mycolicibacterium austroafricanum]QZY47051.1 FAD-dependent oxidoreductase [Mycolicibacterium austroafricanum]